MEFGPHAEWLAQVARDRGDEIPEDAIPPELPIAFAFAYVAFCALSADREAGFGVSGIRFTAIDSYARRYAIDDLDEFEQFTRDVRLIDDIYLKISKKDDK